MRSGSLWNYYRDEIDDVNDNASDGKSFKYRAKTVQKSPGKPVRRPQSDPDPNRNQPPQLPRPPVPYINVEITISVKYLSNFWRYCEVELDLSWTKDFVLSEHHSSIKEGTFQINDAELYVLAVTLSINDNIKFLENIKEGFKRTISWNKYRSEITTPRKNNNLDS